MPDIATDIEDRRRARIVQMREAVFKPPLLIYTVEKCALIQQVARRARIADTRKVEGQRRLYLEVGMKEQAQDPVPPAKDAENAQGAQTQRANGMQLEIFILFCSSDEIPSFPGTLRASIGKAVRPFHKSPENAMTS